MIRIALAQIDPVVGDISGNVARCIEIVGESEQAGAQVVALPELVTTGYPPEDLLLRRAFVEENRRAMEQIAASTGAPLVVVGFVDSEGTDLYNAAAICQDGEVKGVYRKQLLPNYGVFDERRYFEPGHGHILIETQAGVLGVCICEDIWSPTGPVVSQGDAGAQIIVNINASPFDKDKLEARCAMLADRAMSAKASIAYVNCVGGQDELVFDGGSVVVDPDGDTVAMLPQFRETIVPVDVPLGEARAGRAADVTRIRLPLPKVTGAIEPIKVTPIGPNEEIYEALKLALRDYVHKNGFAKVVIGLSGGIDSALTATIAADALGPDAVLGVTMPSEYSSSGSVDDSKALAANLGFELIQMQVAPMVRSYLQTMQEAFGEIEPGLAEENIQARIRGNLLMAISNRYGHLVLATGNKSEMACGYATLYGDMAGGFALLKDLFKTEVYALSRYRNRLGPAIPEATLTKPPSAELKPGQKDSDSLPAYDVLDPILELYIEEDASVADIVAQGFEAEVVQKVATLVNRAEYKRRQAPPGPKVTTKAFGRDRRLPITNHWLEGEGLPERSVGPRK
ncbi:MAG: NAD+ synthase [Actinobacteria bacterium]|nr:NAD+ synthase [Actinomycetota bacterium]